MEREYKDSGIEWIGRIPREWSLVPTKRLFSYKKEIVGDKVDNYERLALTMQGVIKRDKDDNEGLQPEKFDNYQILRYNELVFKLIDLANAKTSRVGLSPYTGIVSPAYIILKNRNENNRYFYYWFLFMYYHLIFNQMGDDGVRSSLNPNDVLNIPIPDISISEQNQISDYLDSKCDEIDKLIELQDEMIKKLNEYKQSVITEAVTKGLNPNAKLVPSGIDWIGEVPEGWKISSISRISTTNSGSTPSNIANDISSSIIWVRTTDINDDEVITSSNKLNEKEFRSASCPMLEPGICLVAMYGGKGTIGKCGILKTKATINQALCSMEVKANYFNYYLFYILRALRPHWMIFAVGTRKDPNINQEIVKRMLIPVPTLPEQRSIATFLDKKCAEIDTLISLKQQKIERLKEYKKSIIYEAVTGKKEVI